MTRTGLLTAVVRSQAQPPQRFYSFVDLVILNTPGSRTLQNRDYTVSPLFAIIVGLRRVGSNPPAKTNETGPSPALSPGGGQPTLMPSETPGASTCQGPSLH